jgi:hypothetical protein
VDSLKNFAYSNVATAPSPATSGTSLVVTAGQGSYFPATPFDATIWPSGSQPSNTNAEIVRVTAVSTDTFTITRAQYGTTAQSIAVGYQIAQTVDANLLNQLAPLSGATFTGEVVVPDLKITGLTGATAGTSRLVGTTSAGPPSTGTFAVGDLVIDQTATIWVCTVAGTPGTWSNIIPNSLVVRSATATAGTGEFTIFGTTGTSGQTITLPANAINGALYQIKNLSAYTVNILGGTNSISVSGTIYSASTPYTIPLNAAYTFVYSGGVWFCFVTTDINKMGGLPLAVTGGGTGTATAPAVGSIPLATSTSVYTPLAIGSSGQVLTSNGTTATWSNATAPAWNFTTRTSSATVAAGETTYSNTNSLTFTLPSAPPNGTTNTFIMTQNAANTVARGGADTLVHSGTTGGTSLLVYATDIATFTYSTANSCWYVTSSGSLNSTYASTVNGTLQPSNGGTGLLTFTAANNALYSTSANALTAGTLPVLAGGTGLVATTVGGIPVGSSTTAFTNLAIGTNGQVLTAGATTASWITPTPTYSPLLNNFLASNYDPGASFNNNLTLVISTSYYQAIYLRAGTTYSTLTTYLSTAGSGSTMNAGLYNATTRLAIGTAIASNTQGAITFTFTSAYTPTTSGVYFVGISCLTASGSNPIVASNSGGQGDVNIGTTATASNLTLRCSQIASSSLPATISGTPSPGQIIFMGLK